MISMIGPIITPACTGVDGAGAATVTTAFRVCGEVEAIYISYVGDDPATTDVTISTQGTFPACPSYNLLVATDNATDKIFIPRVVANLASSGAAQAVVNFAQPVDDFITVTVAQANTGDIIKVWLFVEC